MERNEKKKIIERQKLKSCENISLIPSKVSNLKNNVTTNLRFPYIGKKNLNYCQGEDSRFLPYINHICYCNYNYNLPNSKYTYTLAKEDELYQVERIQIPLSPTISMICQLSENLRKKAVYYSRQLYFLRNKKEYDLANRYPCLAVRFYEFIKKFSNSLDIVRELERKLFFDHKLEISDELRRKLKVLESLNGLYHFLKEEKEFLNLHGIYSQLPKQTLIYVVNSWKSYYESLNEYNKKPESFNSRPKPPSYNKKYNEFIISFSGSFISDERYARGIRQHYYNTKKTNIIRNRYGNIIKISETYELKLPNKFLNYFTSDDPFPTIRTTIDIDKIKEIRILLRKSHYVVEIVYTKQKNFDFTLNPQNALAIDIGLNNLVAMLLI